MPKLESIRNNETHKFLGDLVIQEDHQFLSRRANLVIISKKKNKKKTTKKKSTKKINKKTPKLPV